MRVLVTGSRTWDDTDVIWSALDIFAEQAAAVGDDELVVVHGACFPKKREVMESADYLAYLWTRRRDHPLPVRHDPHPANWKAQGQQAGFVRNQHMVKLGADVCLAFIAPCAKPNCRKPKPHGSHGATDCADLAEREGITVRRFET